MTTAIELRRVRVVHEDSPSNPREDADITRIVSFNRDFSSDGGDRRRHHHEADVTPTEYIAEHLTSADLFLAIDYQDYGSSGVRLVVSDDVNPRTDAIILVTADAIAKEWDGRREDARRYLAGEIQTYETWINGDVYGYVIEVGRVCDLGHEHWETEDSCWGFYGLDVDTNGMVESVPEELHEALRAAAEKPEY